VIPRPGLDELWNFGQTPVLARFFECRPARPLLHKSPMRDVVFGVTTHQVREKQIEKISLTSYRERGHGFEHCSLL
jgi:hypothetical protein